METRFEQDEDWVYSQLYKLHKRATEEHVWAFGQRVFDLIQEGMEENQARTIAFMEMTR
jgi:hypothetical protein